MSLINRIVLGILRHVLTLAAGTLLAHGVISGSQEEVVIGSTLALAGVGLSAAEKVKTGVLTAKSAENAEGSPERPAAPAPEFTGHAGGSGGQGKT